MSGPVRLSVAEGIARIVFCRPERLNALDSATADAFEDAVNAALADSAVRVVLLAGEGRAFMAGGDLSGFAGAEDKPAALARVIDPMHAALKRLESAPCITIAAAQGAVAGAGMSVFLGADLGIAADTVVFNMAYARIAGAPDCGGSWALPRLVGLRRAMALTLLCDNVTAAEALELGLVSDVVPEAELEDAALRLAHRVASGSASSQGRIKALLRSTFGSSYADQLDAEKAAFLACAADPDFAEGLNAFFGKRKPEFNRG